MGVDASAYYLFGAEWDEPYDFRRDYDEEKDLIYYDSENECYVFNEAVENPNRYVVVNDPYANNWVMFGVTVFDSSISKSIELLKTAEERFNNLIKDLNKAHPLNTEYKPYLDYDGYFS